MDKYIQIQAKNKIDELGIVYAMNYFAKQTQLTKEKPDQVILDAADFNMKDAQTQIAWYKKFVKAKK
jgi:hypothetical protein